MLYEVITGDREPAASIARGLLRARQGTVPRLGQGALLRADHPVSRVLAGLRVRPQGHAVREDRSYNFV